MNDMNENTSAMSDEVFAPDELLVSEDLPPDHRSGFVVLVGKPNVGKSTLMNRWLGTKLAPVSPKPQTTRSRLLGILTRVDAQIIFVDTPGIHDPRHRLGELMVSTARHAIGEADLALLMVDGSFPPTHGDERVAELMHASEDVPVYLVINKTDLVTKEELHDAWAPFVAQHAYAKSFSISALTGKGCDELLGDVVAALPEGPRFFPADQISDIKERVIAAELIREQLMRHLEEEVPHATAVVVDEYKPRSDDALYIAATVYVEKESQKGIVIGGGGRMVKRIGTDARRELERFTGVRVFLDLWVKVRKNWRRNERFLRQLGYDPAAGQ
jgi:GTPase